MDRAAASIFASNPALVSLMQNKLSTLVGRSSGYIESLPPVVRRRVTGLKGIQKDHAKLEAEFQEEVLQLEKKYFAKFTPLYEKRAAIVNGETEPTEEEIAAGKSEEEDEEAEPEANNEEKTTAEDAKGIPEFWLSAMKNQISLAELITDRDEEALRALTDIRMEYLDRPGFRLIFEFAPNDFFTNKTISKTYFYREESGYGGDFIYDHAEGDKVDWKAGKDLTVRVESKKQRNKSTLSLGESFTRCILILEQTPSKPESSRRPSPRNPSSTSSLLQSHLLTKTMSPRILKRGSSLTISWVRTSKRSSSPAPLTGSLAKLWHLKNLRMPKMLSSTMRMTKMMRTRKRLNPMKKMKKREANLDPSKLQSAKTSRLITHGSMWMNQLETASQTDGCLVLCA